MFVNLFCFVLIGVPSSVWSAVAKDIVNSCSLSEYACSDGSCVSAVLLCDGHADCADSSDETECQPSKTSLPYGETVLNRSKRQATVAKCRKSEWQCRDGSCIQFDGKCDGVVDCQDRSDETHALCWKNQCQSNWFRCTYGACVDGTAPCNGLQECADNSDELLPRCRNETVEVRGQFKCTDGSLIPASNHCDGVKDCADGSDERIETCAGKTCLSYLFQCAYGACVDSGANCNQVQECADGSDESDELCGTNSFNSATVKPPAGNCVLPPYPEHGTYFTNINAAEPGMSFKYVTVNVSCHRGYGVQGPSTVGCQDGSWGGNIPKCIRQCRLTPHPSVEYHCLVSGDVTGTRACNTYEPVGTVIQPECRRPNYYYPSSLTLMRCIDGYWDYTARCKPGLVKIGTNITILIKDTVEVHKSEFSYVVPLNQYNEDNEVNNKGGDNTSSNDGLINKGGDTSSSNAGLSNEGVDSPSSNAGLINKGGDNPRSNDGLINKGGDNPRNNDGLINKGGDNSSSNAGLINKGDDSPSSNAGLTNKGGDTSSSNAGLTNEGVDSPSSNAGLTNKGGDTSSSNDGLINKGGDNSSSNAGLTNKGGDTSSSNAGLNSKGGDNPSSNDGLINKGDDISISNAGLSNKGDDSPSSNAGLVNKGADNPRSNAGQSNKGDDISISNAGLSNKGGDNSGYYYGQFIPVTDGNSGTGMSDFNFNTIDELSLGYDIDDIDVRIGGTGEVKTKNTENTSSSNKKQNKHLYFYINNSSVYLNTGDI